MCYVVDNERRYGYNQTQLVVLRSNSSLPSEISKRTMNSKIDALSQRYSSALRIYVENGTHGQNKPAIELGRQLIAIGLETLELSRIHEHALKLLLSADTPKTNGATKKAADRFFVQAMKPILSKRHATPDTKESSSRRSAQLAASNLKLKQEIVRRTEAEKLLKERERHVSELLAQSLKMQEHLRQLSRDLLSAQEEERKTISRELHDDVAQTLMGINVHLATLKMEAVVNNKDLKTKIANTQLIVKKSVEIVHRFARKLRPTMLDDLGLIPALASFIKELAKRTGIRVQFTAFPGVEELKSEKRTVLYRVVQEALTNVAKHARATLAKVSIKQIGTNVALEVVDNGKSFRVREVLFSKKNKRLGVLGMRERVEMVDGSFLMESAVGKGTQISVRIPLDEVIES